MLGLCVFAARPAGAEGSAPATDPVTPAWQRGVSLGVVGTAYGAAWVLVSAAWWTGASASDRLVFRNEGAFGLHTYAGGADKLGHVYANYLSNRVSKNVLEWGGFSRAVSITSATLLTTAYFTAIELKDGYQVNYGFSPGDIAANLSGQAAALGLMLLPPVDEALSLKITYFPSRDQWRAATTKEALNVAEDYSGQTYLVSFHLEALPLVRKNDGMRGLRYLDLSLGYGTRGYRPIPRPAAPVRQLLTLGLSMNLQTVLDDLLSAPGKSRSTGARALHFVNEVFQPPGTRVPVLEFERTAAGGGPGR
jgi:hypothetical protein